MNEFVPLASPFWVNLLILVPLLLFYYWRTKKLDISKKNLFYLLILGISFGVIEASCVVYIRASIGLLPGFNGSIMDVWASSKAISYNQLLALNVMPPSLLLVEVIREAATIILMAMISLIAAKKLRERFAIFLWVFAAWDISYYLHLWITTRWPQSLTSPDVLFLIPVPWVGQVWFPILVSSLTLLSVLISAGSNSNTSK